MEFRSHDFEDEPKKACTFHLLSHIQNLSFWIWFEVFLPAVIFGTLSANLERIVSSLSTQYFKKWSQSDFTDVNSRRAEGGILRRMLFIKLHIQFRFRHHSIWLAVWEDALYTLVLQASFVEKS